MSLKDIFSQEVKNMMEKENNENSSASSEENYITQQTNEERVKFAKAALEQAEQEASAYSEEVKKEEPKQKAAEAPKQAAPAPKPYTPSYARPEFSDDEETTIISRNTVVEGNIRSFANVNVEGSIKGDVISTKDAHVSGKLVGNLECNNASMIGSQMQGNVNSKGQVKFNKDSLILGDVSASYLDMNGKVKGNIDISGKAEFKADSYILGDITVASLTVHDGATINGHVNTTFLADSPQTIFPEMISMTD